MSRQPKFHRMVSGRLLEPVDRNKLSQEELRYDVPLDSPLDVLFEDDCELEGGNSRAARKERLGSLMDEMRKAQKYLHTYRDVPILPLSKNREKRRGRAKTHALNDPSIPEEGGPCSTRSSMSSEILLSERQTEKRRPFPKSSTIPCSVSQPERSDKECRKDPSPIKSKSMSMTKKKRKKSHRAHSKGLRGPKINSSYDLNVSKRSPYDHSDSTNDLAFDPLRSLTTFGSCSHFDSMTSLRSIETATPFPVNSFGRLNSQTFQNCLSIEYPARANAELTGRKDRAILIDFDGTLIPYVNAMTKEIGLPEEIGLNPIYLVVLLCQLCPQTHVADSRPIYLDGDVLELSHGCNQSCIEYLKRVELLKPADSTSKTRGLYIVNHLELTRYRILLYNLLARTCQNVFLVLQQCYQLGRLAIVSVGGRLWVDRMLQFLLEALVQRRLHPPRWSANHFDKSDAEMYDLCRDAIRFRFPTGKEDFRYPRSNDDVWNIPVICIKNKLAVFSGIANRWKAQEVVSIGDGVLEFDAAAEIHKWTIHPIFVRRVQFSYMDAHVLPDLLATHVVLTRELDVIVRHMEGDDKDIVITVPALEASLVLSSEVPEKYNFVEPMPDASVYSPLPGMPTYVADGDEMKLVVQPPDDTAQGEVLRRCNTRRTQSIFL